MIYSFIIFFPLIIKQITQENQNKVHGMLKLMGLNDFAYYGSIFLIYFIEFIIQSVALTIIYTLNFKGLNSVFSNINPLLVFLVFLMFGINLILFAILFSIFFNKPSIAIISAIVVYVIFDILQ